MTTLTTLALETTIHKKWFHQFHEYLRNKFPRLRKTKLKTISSLTTLTALIIKIAWKTVLSWLRWYIVYSDYADYADIRLYVKNNFIIDYTDYVVMKATIDNTFMNDYVDIQEEARNSHHWLCWLHSSTSNNYIHMYFLQEVQCSLTCLTNPEICWTYIPLFL